MDTDLRERAKVAYHEAHLKAEEDKAEQERKDKAKQTKEETTRADAFLQLLAERLSVTVDSPLISFTHRGPGQEYLHGNARYPAVVIQGLHLRLGWSLSQWKLFLEGPKCLECLLPILIPVHNLADLHAASLQEGVYHESCRQTRERRIEASQREEQRASVVPPAQMSAAERLVEALQEALGLDR